MHLSLEFQSLCSTLFLWRAMQPPYQEVSAISTASLLQPAAQHGPCHQPLAPLSNLSWVVPTFTNILAQPCYLEFQLLPILEFLSGLSQEALKRSHHHSATSLLLSSTRTQLSPPYLWQPSVIKPQMSITWPLCIHHFLSALFRRHHLTFQIRAIACHFPTMREARCVTIIRALCSLQKVAPTCSPMALCLTPRAGPLPLTQGWSWC